MTLLTALGTSILAEIHSDAIRRQNADIVRIGMCVGKNRLDLMQFDVIREQRSHCYCYFCPAAFFCYSARNSFMYEFHCLSTSDLRVDPYSSLLLA